jgi:hypothetical protein
MPTGNEEARSMSETVLGVEQPLITFQLSFSTADIEQNVFYGEQRILAPEDFPKGEVILAAVNGEMFLLDEHSSPPDLEPLRENSGLLHLADETDPSQ